MSDGELKIEKSQTVQDVPHHRNRIGLYAVIAVTTVVAGLVCLWWFAYQQPRNTAIVNYHDAALSVEAKNATLNTAIKRTKTLVQSGDTPLDLQTLVDAKRSLRSAEQQRRNIGDMPSKTGEIEARTVELKRPLNYDAVIDNLNGRRIALNTSIRQMKQVTDPSGDFVVERLKQVPDVQNPLPVTMVHDPNGNLNKPHSYVAAVYFASPQVDQSLFDSTDVIDNGTDGGGQVEVFKTAADAKRRNTYLSAFDGGGMFDSGSHVVLGTVLIRTSHYLTADQQTALTTAIRSALVKL